MSKIFEALQRAELTKHDDQPNEQSYVSDEISMQAGLSEDLVTLKKPGSVASEQFRLWRSRILKPKNGKPQKTILITSAMQGEGKTFAACNLAVTVAQGLDEHCLLIDADLRNPMVHQMFGLEQPERGLSTYLEKGEPLEKMLYRTVIPKLTILPAGVETDTPAELLCSQRMHSLIEEVRDRYHDRRIIFDSAPINFAPETVVISKGVDAVFLMLLRGSTSREAVNSAMEHFSMDKLRGIIFNKDMKVKNCKRYRYGYGYRSACRTMG